MKRDSSIGSMAEHSDLAIPVNRVAKTIIRRTLREDMGVRGDITTQATVPQGQQCRAHIVAKSGGVIAGQKVAAEVFRSLNKILKYTETVSDGEKVEAGTTIARIKGPTDAVLTGERTALNLLGRCCGIASLTRSYVEAVEGTGVRITETRKTAPGLRYLDKAAVVVGGGVNHRYALYDAFLIKENHISSSDSITGAIQACRASKAGNGRLRVMVEVRNLEELGEALEARPDRILLDNMTIGMIIESVAMLEKSGKEVELEATGGITLENVRAFAETGVDYISIGALTHSVKIMDLSLLLERG